MGVLSLILWFFLEAGLLVVAMVSLVVAIAIAIPAYVLLVPIWILFPGLRYPILGWLAWVHHWFGVYIHWVCGVEPQNEDDTNP